MNTSCKSLTTCSWVVSVLFVELILVHASAGAEAHYLPAGSPDVIAILPDPPTSGTAEDTADLAEVESVVKHRTAAENTRGKSESDFGLESFAVSAGPTLDPSK